MARTRYETGGEASSQGLARRVRHVAHYYNVMFIDTKKQAPSAPGCRQGTTKGVSVLADKPGEAGVVRPEEITLVFAGDP
jgi:hypothetical protein